MSASLVGSEMCIRDRGQAAGRADTAEAAAAEAGQLHPAPRRPQLLPKAVSYTHLTLPTICSV
eukprot:14189014-Alexandrium_andersonii.AAC.1